MLEEGRTRGESRDGNGELENEKQSQGDTQSEEKRCKNVKDDGCYNNGDENVLKFMDSLDSYLTLLDSIASILSQGWFDLASARYTMGASRINTALLDLNIHPAATSIRVSQHDECSHFTLQKWMPRSSEETKAAEDDLQKHSSKVMFESDEILEESSPSKKPALTTEDWVQKERAKSLAVFGTLVPAKLRSAQLSFETALETLVEIVNMRSSMILAYDQVRRGVGCRGTEEKHLSP